MTFNTTTTYTENQSDWLYGYGVLLTNVRHRYLYPYHGIENTGTCNWKHTWNHTVSNHPIHQHGHTNFWYVCFLERVYFKSQHSYYTQSLKKSPPRSCPWRSKNSCLWLEVIRQLSVRLPAYRDSAMVRVKLRRGKEYINHRSNLNEYESRSKFQ